MKKRVLVSGASRGIGRAIAVSLAAGGYEIAVNYRRNRDAAEQTLELIASAGGSGYLLPFDVADRAQTWRALEADVGERGAPFGVVCNAGVTADAPFPILAEEAWDEVLRTNLDSFYNLLRQLVMPMVQARKGGRIVTMSSLSGIAGNRGQVNYSAAKAGVIGATRALAKELARRRITVNCVAPGLIETDMTAQLPKDELIKMIPMRRLGTCEEVAAVVAFLFSDGAGYMTGQVLSVNGGLL